MKRLFIGIPIHSEHAFQMTENWRKQGVLSGNVLKWSTADNWHVTLVFLGSTSETLIPKLQNIIEESFENAQAFHSEIQGVGVFPNLNKPKVLWFGLNDISALMPFYFSLLDLLQHHGFLLENKPFKPHLTLARIKNTPQLKAFHTFAEKYNQTSFGTVPINRVVLYESISTSEGPVYKPLFVKNLAV